MSSCHKSPTTCVPGAVMRKKRQKRVLQSPNDAKAVQSPEHNRQAQGYQQRSG